VLASAAFEDCLKKVGTFNGSDVAERELQEVVNALKAKQILIGAAGKIADQYVMTSHRAVHPGRMKWAKRRCGNTKNLRHT